MTVKNVICSTCNQSMGNGPDKDLAKSVEALRNYGNLKAGDGDDAPQIIGYKNNGQRFDLFPGGRPELRPVQPLEVKSGKDGPEVYIRASNDKHANSLAQGAARKLAKQYDVNNEASIANLYDQIISAKRPSLMAPPEIQHEIELGVGSSQQAMAKATLVLWAELVGNAELLDPKYDAIKQFICRQERTDETVPPTKFDARPLTSFNDEYGSCPCIVWAGSDRDGKVFGYFRLYGIFGWRIDLGQAPAFADKAICLISNPFDPSKWNTFEGDLCPIKPEWVLSEWESYAEECNGNIDGTARLMEELSTRSRNMFMDNLKKEAISESGLKDGQIITEQNIRFISKYIADRLVVTAPRLRGPINEIS